MRKYRVGHEKVALLPFFACPCDSCLALVCMLRRVFEQLVNSRAVTISPPPHRWSSSIIYCWPVLVSVFTLCYRPWTILYKTIKLVVRVGSVFNWTSCPFLAGTSEPSAICQPYIFSRHCDCPTFILSQFPVIRKMYFCCNRPFPNTLISEIYRVETCSWFYVINIHTSSTLQLCQTSINTIPIYLWKHNGNDKPYDQRYLWQIAVSRVVESEFHSRSDSVLQIAQREIISVMGIRCLSLHYQHHNLFSSSSSSSSSYYYYYY